VKLEALLALGTQIPPALNLVDACISGKSRQVESSLVKNLMSQEKALTAYLATHCTPNPQGDLTQQDPVDEDSSMTSKSLFDLTCESLCRICLLLVVESLYNLESHMWPTQSPTFTPQDHATSLCKTMTALTHAAYTPICKARVLSAPLHFLLGFYERRGDHSGTQWCRRVREAICEEAPWLRWDALLPWCLLYPHRLFFEAGSGESTGCH
jgi:hypothetical protein